MRVDGYCPSFSRHLEPRKINLVLNAELGLTVEVSGTVKAETLSVRTIGDTTTTCRVLFAVCMYTAIRQSAMS